MYAISLNPVVLRINLHLGHHVIEFHVLLSNLATILHSLYTFLETIGSDCSACDGRFGDEQNRGRRDERCEHGPRNDRLHGGN